MIVAVVDHFDDEGEVPSAYVERVDECYLAKMWLMSGGGDIDEQVVGAFTAVEPAVRRLRRRLWTMAGLSWPEAFGDLGPPS